MVVRVRVLFEAKVDDVLAEKAIKAFPNVPLEEAFLSLLKLQIELAMESGDLSFIPTEYAIETKK